jgi:hypothetical protein
MLQRSPCGGPFPRWRQRGTAALIEGWTNGAAAGRHLRGDSALLQVYASRRTTINVVATGVVARSCGAAMRRTRRTRTGAELIYQFYFQ